MDLKKITREIFLQTLTRVRPEELMPEMISYSTDDRKLVIKQQSFQLNPQQPLYIIGTGKAAASMGLAAEQIFGDHIAGGFVIIPPGAEEELKWIKMAAGSHPIPDDSTFRASAKLIEFVKTIPDDAFVINMVSGGTSSLFEQTVPAVPEDQLSEFYKMLIESGAAIDEINTVRPAVSSVKGGGFLSHLKHTRLVDLIISDIPDDNLKYVGSGPTTAQEISYTEAKKVLQKYDIWDECPPEIKKHIEKNSLENPVVHTPDIESHDQFLLSSASLVAGYANDIAQNKGFQTRVAAPAWTGPLEEFVEKIEQHILTGIQKYPSRAGILFFGEPTVKVTGDGLGGRNQELALRVAKILPRFQKKIAFLSGGTDGIDGPTDAAGAVVNQDTCQNAIKNMVDPDTYIQRNDSYHFFKVTDGHIKTGPTGNNVMDLQIVLWE